MGVLHGKQVAPGRCPALLLLHERSPQGDGRHLVQNVVPMTIGATASALDGLRMRSWTMSRHFFSRHSRTWLQDYAAPRVEPDDNVRADDRQRDHSQPGHANQSARLIER